jgi:LuxR family transcriptional regulator, maltose regulon positive regulatory protein
MEILKTKLTAPPLRAALVSRPRLLDKLDSGLSGRLTLVSAPAGFGKTTLVSEWYYRWSKGKQLPSDRGRLLCTPYPEKISWLSLDVDDNDPVRFLTCLIRGMESIFGQLVDISSALLESPNHPPLKAVLANMVSTLEARFDDGGSQGKRLVIILDDYHLINTAQVHEAVSYFLNCIPPFFHLLIISRTDPALPIARLRSQGQLNEIRAADLRFSIDEAASFLKGAAQISLSPAELAALETRTEGWIAGLQLAALCMQSSTSVSDFIQNFTGSHRYIIDYLLEEVFQSQTEDDQRFLLQTCILERLSGPLCNALTGGSSSQAVLERFESANLFLVPLDDERHWYRYHRLFKDFLISRLLNSNPALKITLHNRAAQWHLDNGYLEETFSHAQAGRNFGCIEALLEKAGGPLLTTGRWNTVNIWLNALPDSRIRERPLLGLLSAWALFLTGRWDIVDTHLQNVENVLDKEPDKTEYDEATNISSPLSGWRGQVATIRAQKASLQGDIAAAIEESEKAIACLPEEDLIMRGIVAVNLGFAYTSCDQWDKARHMFELGIAASQAGGNQAMALSAENGLSETDRAEGRLIKAASRLKNVIEKSKSKLNQSLLGAYYNIAEVLYELNDLEAAEENILQAINLAEQLEINHIRFLCQLRMARIKQARGETKRSKEMLYELEKSNHPQLDPLVSSIMAVHAINSGDWDELKEYLNNKNEILSLPFSSINSHGYFVLIQALLEASMADQAEELLERIKPSVIICGHQGTKIGFNVISSLFYWKRNEIDRALDVLHISLELSEKGGYVRSIIDFGPTVREILLVLKKQRKVSQVTAVYINQLLQAFVSSSEGITKQELLSGPVDLQDPLTTRELEILSLMAGGLSNQKIASKLFLSLGTVKSHAHHIFVKLEVQNRVQAISRGKEMGLIN